MKLSHELKTAVLAARLAGKIQLKQLGKPLQKTMKGEKDFVTQVDLACEKAILGVLQKEFPDYGILSEEKGTVSASGDYRWVVDPLDGTLRYSRGMEGFGVLIALQKKGDTILAVLHQPNQSSLLVAEKGKGAFHNNHMVHVSAQSNLSKAILSNDTVQYFLDQYPAGFKKIYDQAAYRIATPWLTAITKVCRGELDIFLGGYQKYSPAQSWLMSAWDVAAPKFLIEEAGGIFSNAKGETTLEKMDCVVASNGHLHPALIKILQATGAKA
ncbi:MAG: inositol monophosphatase [Candidatus Micrarchaeota archaeon]